MGRTDERVANHGRSVANASHAMKIRYAWQGRCYSPLFPGFICSFCFAISIFIAIILRPPLLVVFSIYTFSFIHARPRFVCSNGSKIVILLGVQSLSDPR